MDVWVARNGQQFGPFAQDDLLKQVNQGRLAVTDLAWREGLPSWVPLSQLLPPLSTGGSVPPQLPAVPIEGGEPLPGLVSFWMGIAGVVFWVVVLAIAASAAAKHYGNDSGVMMAVGLFVFLGFGVNLVGVVLGFVAATRRHCRKTLSILGITLNALEFLGVLFLMLIGMSAKS